MMLFSSRIILRICILLSGVIFVAADDIGREPMQLIGAGLGRTSTMSLYTALNSIGYKTHHMFEVLNGKGQSRVFADYFNGVIDADNLMDFMELAGYNATTDFPGCLLYKEYLNRNPSAKVILSIRDNPTSWAHSVSSTIGGAHRWAGRRPFTWVLDGFDTIDAALWESFDFDVRGNMNPVSAASFYTSWMKEVKANVPKSQLLIHNAKEGWPPLCDFLSLKGDDCPSNRGEMYPHVNDTAEIKQLFDRFLLLVEYFDLILGAIIGIGIAVLVPWIAKQIKKQFKTGRKEKSN